VGAQGMVENDEKVMLAVRDGEVAKLGVLFDRHYRVLFDFFARMTGNRTAAEDLVQDVFFRMLKYRKTYRDDSRFTSWMFHIARNARADYFKKQKPEVPVPDEGFQLPSHAPFPSKELEHQQDRALLECALFKLAPEKREVLVLSRYHDMKYEQIAELLDCEVGTVKVRVFRALKELRDVFFRLSREKQPCNVKRSEASLRIM
jgi:RNA polymerase sigma-70 factor (ECF subfamily)